VLLRIENYEIRQAEAAACGAHTQRRENCVALSIGIFTPAALAEAADNAVLNAWRYEAEHHRVTTQRLEIGFLCERFSSGTFSPDA
jgi:hypothetical protein